MYRHAIISIFLFFVFSVDCFGSSKPNIFFESGEAFDFQCSQMVPEKGGVTESEIRKVKQMIPQIQRLWNEKGQSLLTAAESVISKKFKRSELSVALITCRAVIAVSHPTVINMKPFLKMGIEGNEQIFLDTVFHELIHRLLDEHFVDLLDSDNPKAAKLINKYKKDGAIVLAHVLCLHCKRRPTQI